MAMVVLDFSERDEACGRVVRRVGTASHEGPAADRQCPVHGVRQRLDDRRRPATAVRRSAHLHRRSRHTAQSRPRRQM